MRKLKSDDLVVTTGKMPVGDSCLWCGTEIKANKRYTAILEYGVLQSITAETAPHDTVDTGYQQALYNAAKCYCSRDCANDDTSLPIKVIPVNRN